MADRTPEELVAEVNIEAGRPIWRPPMATAAMLNLISAAQAQQRSRRNAGLQPELQAGRCHAPEWTPRRCR
jgi:hypothetical protein